jgi:2-polyprenyl-3-methyl-5-hydroxy-6-metoxy-1,4-benzoquinol methylase
MQRFDWERTKEYWRDHRGRAGELDERSDPDALGNVCHSGAPAWLNDYYARFQRIVFEELLDECALPPGSRALDVGCGAGRWCRLLDARGYLVTGIDLQDELVARARAKYPSVRFEVTPIQEFRAERPFDLVTTVTVLQHLPHAEQRRAIANIASLVRPGGYVLCLENVLDQTPHVFANTLDEWTARFTQAGFSRQALRRYDYSPFLRISSGGVQATAALARRLGVMRPMSELGVPRAPGADGAHAEGSLRRVARSAGWAARRVALVLDERVEPVLVRFNAELSTVHCAFLFRRN